MLPEGQVLQPGDRFVRPFVEASTKWEAVDRYLTPAEAAPYVKLGFEQLTELYQWVSAVAQLLDELYANAEAKLIDGKLEAALFRKTGAFVIIDGISLDELGVWYNGQQYGKNPLRDWYKATHPDWCRALQEAQKAHPDDPSQWPEYPPLDADVAAAHVARYSEMAALLQGVLHSST